MPIDSVRLGAAFREIKKASDAKKSFHINKTHHVGAIEKLDPSLTNQLVYKNRQDWFVSAAITGFFSVDIGVQQGGRRFVPLLEAKSIVESTSLQKKKNGMRLY